MAAKVIPVKVAVRIRPISEKEDEEGCQSVVRLMPGRPQVCVTSAEKAFTFDYAFDHDSTQDGVYSVSVRDLIPSLFDGYNVTVLAYGQTGSGKTHSMGTSYRSGQTPRELAGIIPRAVGDIFEQISARSDKMDVSVSVAFVELYREQLYDLLSAKSSRKEDCACELREDPVKGVVIPGLTELAVGSVDDTMRQLESGSVKRVTAATAMNNTSSRSHAIFTVLLHIVNKDEGGNATVSKFHLVDLAGSERSKKTKASGDRFKEGTAINQGLLALGNVIAALGEDNPVPGKTNHIPYRNSKLTRLLQDSLGGNSYTLMVACVSPADSNVDETLSTLRYADRARKIKNKPIVNINGSDAEVNRLRAENQELRLKLLEATGGESAVTSAKASEELVKANEELRDENRRMTHALMAAQDELTHMNEKVLMHESTNEKLKTKFKELAAELDVLVEKEAPEGSPQKKVLEDFRGRVEDVVKMQEEAERTIVDYDVSRAEQYNDSLASCAGGEGDDSDDDEHDEYVAAHAVKRNAITVELQNLNKALAQKEKLASAMSCSEQKLQEMRKTYEGNLQNMEAEIRALQKEKDELHQHQRNAAATEATSKISEQRRKKIQELEGKIGDLRKKVLEQQKAIKTNEKNEAQLKKLSEEIRQLKQTKVRLIRQFKEDAEKLRAYKQEKEKEVQKLKQNERKQQAKIVKMENLHSKQQNVMRRKMEEAINANKRLKDVLEKQKGAAAFSSGRGGLAGAGERVRNWVNGEVNVVVSVKEATQSRELLISDRKTLTRELNELKRGMRDTMTGEDMEEHQRKMARLKDELEARNVQIAQLQKQIADSEGDGSGKASSAGVNSAKNRFDQFKSLTEAKIALEHLFEKSVEQTFCQQQLKSEFEELRQLYDEAVKNTNALEKEIAGMKGEHEADTFRLKRDHEEKVLDILSQIQVRKEAGGSTLVMGGAAGPKLHLEEAKKVSKLNEELIRENERLKEQMMQGESSSSVIVAKKKPVSKPRPKHLSAPKGESHYTVDEFFSEEEEGDLSMEDDKDFDPDWHKTPLCKRIRQVRETAEQSKLVGLKRKVDSSEAESGEDDDLSAMMPKPKRASRTNSKDGCACKKDACKTKRCACRKKKGSVCTDTCGCNPEVCQNRDGDAAASRSPLSDATNNDTANTASMLNDTYTSSVLGASSLSNVGDRSKRDSVDASHASPKKRSFVERPSYFRSPMADPDDGENAAPKSKLVTT